MITWFMMLLLQESKAGVLISGGITAMPTAPIGLAPAWRLGALSGRTTIWISATWAYGLGTSDYGGGTEQEVTGFGVLPQIGFRRDLTEPVADGIVPFVAGSTSVGIFSYKVDGEKADNGSFEGPIVPPIGLSGGVGLDAPITTALSVSGELGLDVHTTRLPVSGSVFAGTTLLTYGAIHFNIWL